MKNDAFRGRIDHILIFHTLQLIPTLYLPDATIVWNGHPIAGSTNLAALLNSMPGSKHEVQMFDCHPLGGGTIDGQYHFQFSKSLTAQS